MNNEAPRGERRARANNLKQTVDGMTVEEAAGFLYNTYRQYLALEVENRGERETIELLQQRVEQVLDLMQTWQLPNVLIYTIFTQLYPYICAMLSAGDEKTFQATFIMSVDEAMPSAFEVFEATILSAFVESLNQVDERKPN